MSIEATSVHDPSALLSFALELAAAAADQILPRFQNVTARVKPDGTLVTEADEQAELEMRRRISARYPAHGIIGEELGETTGRERLRWLLDPLDGTAAFALGRPSFGTLVALLEDDEPLLGVIHLPITGESLYAERGRGCWYAAPGRESERVTVASEATRLATARVSLAGVDASELRDDGTERRCRLGELLRRAGELVFIPDCTQHFLVGMGRLDAAIDTLMYPWDSGAIVVCVREAGGVVTTVSGATQRVVFGGSLVTASTPALLEEIVDAIHP